MTWSEPGMRARAKEYSVKALEALASGRPMIAYDYEQAWISNGGAKTLGPWLVAVAGALQTGQHKRAVHAANLALEHWIGDDAERGVLHFVRGEVIRRHLKDPKTARADLDRAAGLVPAWLSDEAAEAAAICREQAVLSRKRKPSVDPAPDYTPSDSEHPWATTVVALDGPVSEGPPFVWDEVHRVLVADDPRVPTEQRWER